ncbi:MAG: DUF2062 domain-containing protein [Deltaproteobacteria bacterium]|nr:MAG: DUF2062 domain-containing protein [Deltaproteobacteria bacterium]
MAGFQKLKDYIKKTMEQEGDERRIAFGFALGVFISFTPFFSLHTILALVFAFLLRLNKIATVAGAWVNNPYTVPFIYYLSYKLGAYLMGWRVPPPDFHNFSFKVFTHYLKFYGVPLLLGTSIAGAVASLVSFYVMLYSIRALRRRKRRKE